MFCSDSPDLILSNICSIVKHTIIVQYYGAFYRTNVPGVLKTRTNVRFFVLSYSSFFHTLTQKSNPHKIPKKIKQNPNFHSSTPLSYPISSKPTKIKYFSHFTTQKSNSHLTKNLPTISKSSLFISTFTDNNFPSKNYKLYHLYQHHTHHANSISYPNLQLKSHEINPNLFQNTSNDKILTQT